MDKDELTCSYCGRVIPEKEEGLAFALTNGSFICADCIKQMYDQISDQESPSLELKRQEGKMTPSKIKNFLDQYVIGQDHAKNILSNAVYRHYMKLSYKQKYSKMKNYVEVDSSNIILLGGTGCGKSHLIKTISRLLTVPYTIDVATSLSQTG